MVTNLRETASVADKISNGDLTVTPKPLSERDTLGIALQSMVERLRGVVGDALAAADNVSSAARNCLRLPNSCRRVPPNRHPLPKKPPLRWKKWPPTSSRTLTMRPRPRRSRASPPRMQRPAVKRLAVPSSPCGPLRRRSPSSRKSRVRPTFWHSMRCRSRACR